MRKLQFVVSVILFFTLTTKGQEDDISKYFNDGGIAEASKLIKVGIDPLNGEIPIMFEHRITKHISVEWGAGPVLLNRQANLYKDIQQSSTFGFNVWANLRIYIKGYYERF